mmetsp:Transcript_131648/g.421160  ORF Transcript_131648/g.421160 Transcript_131648/m.421160 type:complete len:95 (-) Transcript_131648:34-318(-)
MAELARIPPQALARSGGGGRLPRWRGGSLIRGRAAAAGASEICTASSWGAARSRAPPLPPKARCPGGDFLVSALGNSLRPTARPKAGPQNIAEC